MSASHHHLLPSQALELAASLDTYRDSVRALVRDPRDAALQQLVRAQVRAMGEVAAMLPPVWVPWGEFAVLHFKVVSPRWRIPGIDTRDLFRITNDHEEARAALQRKCIEWATAQRTQPPRDPPSAVA
jgi:hypothetical protein